MLFWSEPVGGVFRWVQMVSPADSCGAGGEQLQFANALRERSQ